MKTIYIERQSEEVILPNGNPLVVCNNHISIIAPNVISVIRTGLKIKLPEVNELVLYSDLQDYVSTIKVFVDYSEEIVLLVMNTKGVTINFDSNTPIAKLAIVKRDFESVRYVEKKDGKMIRYSVSIEENEIK